MTTEDEFGIVYLVKSGDPANWQVLAMARHGFDFAVLPRYNYLTGKLHEPLFEPGDVIKAARLYDCLGVLAIDQ